MLMYLKDEKIEDLIKEGKVIVDFYADWCGPCQIVGEELELLQEENKDIKIVKVNVDKHEDIAYQYRVMSIPTIYAYENGKEITHSVGVLEKDEIIALFENK